MLIQIVFVKYVEFLMLLFHRRINPKCSQSFIKYNKITNTKTINTIWSVSIHIIGCTISQGSIVANVVEEVGGPVTSRAILSLLQAPGGVQALRSKRKYHIVSVCICGRKLRYMAFTCKIRQKIYPNLSQYDFLFSSICNQGQLHMMGTRYAECTRKVQYQVMRQQSLVTSPHLLPKKGID